MENKALKTHIAKNARSTAVKGKQNSPFFSGTTAAPPTGNNQFIQRLPNPDSSSGGLMTLPAQTTGALPVVGSTPISLGDFKIIMDKKFGVRTVKTGTRQEQETSLARNNLPPATIPNWQSWDPGSSSMIYNYIVQAFEGYGQSMWATPIVNSITFFKMNYDRNFTTGVVTPNPDVGADFGITDLNIYEAISIRRDAIPYARSINGPYTNPPVLVVTASNSTPGAPMAYPTQQESVIRMVTHELGHGAQSAAMNLPNSAHAKDPHMMDDYRSTVGWTNGMPPKLYDIGVPAVAGAIAAGTTPSSRYEITASNWNSPQWVEQPVSRYSVTGGPGEDFAEAIMVYVTNPALLRSRSPKRYNFIHNRHGRWLSQMRLYAPAFFSPPGDYPIRTLPEGTEYA